MFKGVEKLSLTETPDPSTKAIVGKKETHIRLNKMSTSNRCFIRKQWWDACHGVVRIKQSQMKSSERNPRSSYKIYQSSTFRDPDAHVVAGSQLFR